MYKRLNVVKVTTNELTFDDGTRLFSDHDQNCCENHFLGMGDLTLKDFEGLEFDLSNDNFFKRIPDYGIELIPTEGWAIKIPGYGYNNGYYGTNIDMVVKFKNGDKRIYNISDCQVIEG